MIALHRTARLLGLIASRHPQGSLTGWSCLSRAVRTGDDFSRRRRTPLGVFPLTADPYPYDSPKDAA